MNYKVVMLNVSNLLKRHIQGVPSEFLAVIHITCKSPSLQFNDLRTLMGHPILS